MKISSLLLGFVLLLFVSCSEESQQSVTENVATVPSGELDLSRTNPIRNTPSRLPSDTTQLADVEGAIADGRIFKDLPAGIEPPEGMIFVPGGKVNQGSATGLPREQPVMAKTVRGFFMDEHPVTVAQYRAFVKETGYITQAEQFGNSIVFDLPQQGWLLRDGANWQYPLGPDFPKAKDKHPATHISWNDAVAYCQWAGKRLPTETEFEHAARNGKNTQDIYTWGPDIKRAGKYYANIWQGNFPFQNTGEDGFLYTSPVGQFNVNQLGLKDMSGNVWEWCSDWYQTYGDNPVPLYDNTETREPEKVMRGGSFMCDPSYCHGYRVSGRSGSTPESGLFHVGFRGVKDIAMK